jgi:hypothetical protein
MIDYSKIQLFSGASSNKLLLEGSSSFNIAPLGGAGETFSVATVPHPFGSDNLLYQVAVNSNTVGAIIDETVIPWSSNDNRIICYARVDTTNLYVFTISSDSSGLGAPAFTVNFTYRILVP